MTALQNPVLVDDDDALLAIAPVLGVVPGQACVAIGESVAEVPRRRRPGGCEGEGSQVVEPSLLVGSALYGYCLGARWGGRA